MWPRNTIDEDLQDHNTFFFADRLPEVLIKNTGCLKAKKPNGCKNLWGEKNLSFYFQTFI